MSVSILARLAGQQRQDTSREDASQELKRSNLHFSNVEEIHLLSFIDDNKGIMMEVESRDNANSVTKALLVSHID
jgi:hypothetical protein